jgi:hypothetical protein
MKRLQPGICGVVALVTLVLAGCFPTTTRPAFLAQASAPVFEVELAVPQATRALAVALDGDSFPVRRTEPKDGWLESEWFDASTLRSTTRRPLGPDIVKLRAFVDPSRPNHSNITIELVYHPLADPSRSDRALEREVPSTHPVEGRVVLLIAKLVKTLGGDTTVVNAPTKAGAGGAGRSDPRRDGAR